MGNLAIYKIVDSLPNPLEPNTLYFVKVANGDYVNMYITDATGNAAYQLADRGNRVYNANVMFWEPYIPRREWKYLHPFMYGGNYGYFMEL